MERLLSFLLIVLIGYLAQFIDGTIGMGYGAFSASLLIGMGLEQFRQDLVGGLLVGGVMAAPLAAYLCKRLPTRVLGIIVGIALIGFNLSTILRILL